MTNERKQSLNEQEVTSRTSRAGLPSAGTPPIGGLDYTGAPVEFVQPGKEDPTVDRRQVLPAPRNLEIVNQDITYAPDGTQYVTITLQFDNVEGAEDYEYRIAKV